jgi:hypothetical protein
MNFTKIKYDGKKVELHWNEKRPKGTDLTHTLTSTEPPAPEMRKALDKFDSFVEELLEVPSIWMDSLTVTGLSINEEEDGRQGLIITSQKKLAGANAPLVINTPHLREPTKLGEEGPGFFIDGMSEATTTAEEAAENFVKGKRAQRSLFDEEKPADKKRQLELAGTGAE